MGIVGWTHLCIRKTVKTRRTSKTSKTAFLNFQELEPLEEFTSPESKFAESSLSKILIRTTKTLIQNSKLSGLKLIQRTKLILITKTIILTSNLIRNSTLIGLKLIQRSTLGGLKIILTSKSAWKFRRTSELGKRLRRLKSKEILLQVL